MAATSIERHTADSVVRASWGLHFNRVNRESEHVSGEKLCAGVDGGSATRGPRPGGRLHAALRNEDVTILPLVNAALTGVRTSLSTAEWGNACESIFVPHPTRSPAAEITVNTPTAVTPKLRGRRLLGITAGRLEHRSLQLAIVGVEPKQASCCLCNFCYRDNQGSVDLKMV